MKETNPDFCTGVQILISRMKSNPEEFTKGDKWYWVMSKVVDVRRNPIHHSNTLPELTVEEIDALFDAYTPFLRKSFNDSVLKEVLADAEELSYRMTSAPPVVLGNPPPIGNWANPTTMTSSKSFTHHLTHVNKHKATLNALGLKEKP